MGSKRPDRRELLKSGAALAGGFVTSTRALLFLADWAHRVLEIILQTKDVGRCEISRSLRDFHTSWVACASPMR